MKNYKLWTKEEDEKIRELVNGGKSYRQIAAIFKTRSAFAIQLRARRYLDINNPYIEHKWTKNESFWEIPNPINCYYAGFSAADASIQKYTNGIGHIYRLEIHERDVSVLEDLKSKCSYNGPIFRSERTTATGKKTIHVRLCINSATQWAEDLKKNFGIGERKTFRLCPPNINNDYLEWCYLIGLIDGDGTISFTANKSTITIKIYSCSFAILEWAKRLIDSKGFVGLKEKEVNIKNIKNSRCYTYGLCGYKAIQLFEFLKTFDLLKLHRKWNNPEILSIIENYKKAHNLK